MLSPHACNFFYMSTMSVSGSDDHIIPSLGPHIQIIIQQEWRIIQEDSALIYRQFCRDIGFGFSFFGKTLFIYSFIQPAIFRKHTSNWATMCCKTSILPPLPPATGHSLQPFPPHTESKLVSINLKSFFHFSQPTSLPQSLPQISKLQPHTVSQYLGRCCVPFSWNNPNSAVFPKVALEVMCTTSVL